MSIYEDLFGSDYRGNVPAVGIASAILGTVNANNLGKRASNVLEPNPFDKSFPQTSLAITRSNFRL